MRLLLLMVSLTGCVAPPPCPWTPSIPIGATGVDPLTGFQLFAGEPIPPDEPGLADRLTWRDQTADAPVPFTLEVDLDAGRLDLWPEAPLAAGHRFEVTGPAAGARSVLRVDRLPDLSPVAVTFTTGGEPGIVAAFGEVPGDPIGHDVLVVFSEPIDLPPPAEAFVGNGADAATSITATPYPTVWRVGFDTVVGRLLLTAPLPTRRGAEVAPAEADVAPHPSNDRPTPDALDLVPYVAEATCGSR